MFYLLSKNGVGDLPTSLHVPDDLTQYLKIINGIHLQFIILFLIFILIYLGIHIYCVLKYNSNIHWLFFSLSSCSMMIVWVILCIHKLDFIVMSEVFTVLLAQLLSMIFLKNMFIVCFLFWICVLFSIISLLKNNTVKKS